MAPLLCPLGCDPGFDGVLTGLRASLAAVERLVEELVREHQREVERASLRLKVPPPSLRLPAAGDALYAAERPHTRDSLECPLDDVEAIDDADDASDELEVSWEEVDNTSAEDTTLDVNTQLRDCLLEKRFSEDKLRELLQLNADPNAFLGPFNCNGKEFKDGTPVAMAVLRGEPCALRVLVEAGGHPDSEYSFEAGAEQLLWSGPASHGTTPRGDVHMLKMLLEFNADINATGSNDVMLLWQAAYFDQPQMLEFLIGHDADLESRAISQDDTSVSLTALHVAANAGHYRSVELLLRARADVQVDNLKGVQPLEDAVSQGHASVTQLLVASGADLFHVPYGHKRTLNTAMYSSDTSHEGCRCIDTVFRSQNPCIVAAVAEGLKALPELPPELTKEDLVEFLSSPGDAPLIILDVIFRQTPIVFWDARQNRKKRRTKMLAGFISGTAKMNVSQGPCRDAIDSLFFNKQAAPDALLDFLERLAPQFARKKSSMFVPLSIYTCPMRHVHRDLNVLRALADCSKDEVFEKRGCQAIVNLKWQNGRRNARWFRIMMFVEVLNLQFISFFLNSNPDQTLGFALIGANTLALCLWSLMVVLEVAMALGYHSCGLVGRYLWRTGTLCNVLAILLGMYTIAEISILRFDAPRDPRFCITLGTVIFAKWIRWLFSIAQVKSMGLRILPITSTMLEALPFCGVLLMCLLASTSFYFALGILNFPECFVILYRLYALGDVDLFEMENTWAPMLSLPTAAGSQGLTAEGVILQEAPAQTPYFWVVRSMMVILSFLVGVSMMNLFVAILCRSYVKAAESAMTSFMRNRACVVLDMHAVRLGLSVLVCRRRNLEAACTMGSKEFCEGCVAEDTAYVWYVVHKAPCQARSAVAIE